MKHLFKAVLSLSILGCAIFVSAAKAETNVGDGGEIFSDELIAEGQAIYEELGCAGCHEPDEPVEGNTAPKLENLAERYTADGIAALLDAPPGPMPRFDLDDADKRALAAFLLSTY